MSNQILMVGLAGIVLLEPRFSGAKKLSKNKFVQKGKFFSLLIIVVEEFLKPNVLGVDPLGNLAEDI